MRIPKRRSDLPGRCPIPTGILRTALLLVLLHPPAPAQWQSVGDVDSLRHDSPSAVTLYAGSGVARIEILGSEIVRVRFAGGSQSPGTGTSWAVVGTPPPSHVRIERSADRITLSTTALTVVADLRPLRIRFLDPAGRTVNEDSPNGMSWSPTHVRVGKSMPPDEEYLGFGGKSGRFTRRNTHMTMWNSDIPAYAADTDPLYQSIPFFTAIRRERAHGIFLDAPERASFDMGKESRVEYSFGAESHELTYYYLSGPTPARVMAQYTSLTGRMPLPPRWSLGYQQCRWSYAPDSRVREIARQFRSLAIPCDVLYLDIDYMEGYRVFTWNSDKFPEPQKLLGDLARDGFRTVVIIDPGIKVDSTYHAYRSGLAGNHFVRKRDGSLFIGDVWPGPCAFPDFSNRNAREWWGEQFAPLLRDGISGFWTDMNEPSVFNVPLKTIDLDALHRPDLGAPQHAAVHNIYGLEMTRATREGVSRHAHDRRPFILTRASYAGGQRYAAAWTGDNVSSWEHLRMALTMSLGFSLAGQPFVGSDIGGFIGVPSGELFARWLQLGAFTPLMRAHSVINEPNKEPWEFGEKITAINRQTIELRYRLLPYLYSTMEYASRTGEPAMRPIAYAYPARTLRAWDDDQFLLGADLLVAPVLTEGTVRRKVYLPPGEWWNYWTSERFTGDTSVTVDAPLDRIPLFVRGGAAIPMQQVVQYTDQAPVDPLTLRLYPPRGPAPGSELYEDDGVSLEYAAGVFLRRKITQKRNGNSLTITLGEAEGSYSPPPRSLHLQVAGRRGRPERVLLDGREIAERKTNLLSPGWEIDGESGELRIVMTDTRKSLSVRILD